MWTWFLKMRVAWGQGSYNTTVPANAPRSHLTQLWDPFWKTMRHVQWRGRRGSRISKSSFFIILHEWQMNSDGKSSCTMPNGRLFVTSKLHAGTQCLTALISLVHANIWCPMTPFVQGQAVNVCSTCILVHMVLHVTTTFSTMAVAQSTLLEI